MAERPDHLTARDAPPDVGEPAGPVGGKLPGPPLLPPGLDEIDLRILKLLAEDARLSQRALARAIGMSAAAVADRVARLEEAGVIEGYHARISLEALDRSLAVFVGISSIQGKDQRKLAAQLRALPVVESIDIVMGPMDLMVKLRVRDHTHLREVFFEQLLTLPGIHRTESFVSLGSMDSKNFAKDLLESMLQDGPETAAPES